MSNAEIVDRWIECYNKLVFRIPSLSAKEASEIEQIRLSILKRIKEVFNPNE